MLEPLQDVGRWLWVKIPKDLRSKYFRLNFIMVHYLYILTWSILGSIILYGGGLIPYVDAVFFAAGASTQSGLNTINVNDMKTYQQVYMYFVACFTNPIFINGAVVFVRLHWFEKRFEHVVKETREQRRSRAKTITRSKSEMKETDIDLHQLEMGVNGREIRVLHDTTLPNGMSGPTAKSREDEAKFMEKMGLDTHAKSVEPTPEGSNASSGSGSDEVAPDDLRADDDETGPDNQPATPEHHLGLHPTLHRQITFADEVGANESGETPELARVPDQVDASKHIEFLERQQRNAREGSTLRIPGPRDFDRGEVPREMQRSDTNNDLAHSQTRNTLQTILSESSREGMTSRGTDELNGDDHPPRSGIKFDDQQHPGRRQETATFESAPTSNSKAGMQRIKSGISTLRHRRSNSNGLHLKNARGSIGRTFTSLTTVRSRDPNDPMPYLSWQATIGRNSAFVGLTEEQREELGGIEYRSLKTLKWTLLAYYFGFHILAAIVLIPWILHTQPWKGVVRDAGTNPTWWGVFSAASLFNDLGLTLTPDSFLSFQRAVLPLLLGSFLIVIGNTGFPIMLRFVIWVTSKVVPYGSGVWEEYQFLLDHPRRCFTLLFQSKATWWLFWVLVILNSVDLIFFIILDLNDRTVTSIPVGYRILDGWFQAASTRTAGFSVVNLSDLHPAIQVSYLVMMYISVFPIAISVRRTNVYEEKSLGVFGGEEEGEEGSDPSYVGQHLRRQLSFDLWYIFLGFFIICIVEGDRLGNNTDYSFTMFSVLFEIVSAYGTVGLSLGYPGTDPSFSAQFRVISKLVIVAMMIRGRHRGLPYALDRAILLPSEKLQKKEAEELDRRTTRRNSFFTEGHDFDRPRHGHTWSQTENDDSGMPRHHNLARQQTVPANSMRDPPPSAGEQSPERTRTLRRRTSGLSSASGNAKKRARSMSLSGVGRTIAGGLSAGPTYPKHE
ncbi:low affinity potassium transporter [Saxophila tyrrhenica]|uniref:Potassium transport protein n=1 Tax=Saxophila tyrrhenica TaxID=1690608 RepID=A0AAV9P4R5_9PEZI|nr:low affinity potassium transporter [Saxophila tyrrhenica]